MIKYVRLKDLAQEKFDESLVILNHQTGEIITLNETAAFIWDLLRKPISSKELLSKLKAKYDLPHANEVQKTLGLLLHARIIKKFTCRLLSPTSSC